MSGARSLHQHSSLTKPISYRAKDDDTTQALIHHLDLQPHPEGGYYTETDRDPRMIPNPLQSTSESHPEHDATRSASSTIWYLLTPSAPLGAFHRNRSQTLHTWNRGRGRYVIIHADERDIQRKARVESFAVGPDVMRGERRQWQVSGGKYKGSYLLPDSPNQQGDIGDSGGLLISEVSISVAVNRV